MSWWNAVLDAVNPLQPYYATGGLLNELTGGDTTTLSFSDALAGGSPGTRFSETVQAASIYEPGGELADGRLGGVQIPFVNQHTAPAAAELLRTMWKGVGLPDLPDEDDLKKWLVGGAVVVGGLVVLLRS